MRVLIGSLLFGLAAATLTQGIRITSLGKVHLPLSPRQRVAIRDAMGLVGATETGFQTVVRTQIASSGVMGLMGVALVWAHPTVLNVVGVGVLVAAAWEVPLVVARVREKQRREQFDVELTDALGEMVMGVEAGLTLESVMDLYRQRRSTSLASEFGFVLDHINLGMSRVDAMKQFAERTPTSTVRTFVSAIMQNQKLGTPLAEVLRQQAQTTRRQRRQSVEEYAAKLSLKMIFPTVFCVLPLLLIVIVGPALIRLVHALPN